MNKIIIKSRGREISEDDLVKIKEIVNGKYSDGRTYISKEISKYWGWYQPNGQLKDMACREILLHLERSGYIKLPPSKRQKKNQLKEKHTLLFLPGIKEENIEGRLKEFKPIKIKLAHDIKTQNLWNKLVRQYHYQGYQRIVGANLKYICYSQDKPIACLGWGAAAWNTTCRDKYIGWRKEIKDKNLLYIVNNVRFLILPGVKIKYLASHLLSLSIKQVTKDWQKKYRHPIYLLETFVEKERFSGTSYKAANWIYLGETKGHAKRGNTHSYHGSKKMIFVYPLIKNFRERLCQ